MATIPTSGDAPQTRGRRRAPLRREDQPSDLPLPTTVVNANAARVRAGVIYGLGALLLAINAWFGTYSYVVVQAMLWTQTSLQRGPLVMLFAIVAFNFGVSRLVRRWALTQQEILILYAMLAIGTCAAGYGFVQQLINQMIAPVYFATGGNAFKDRILPHVPTWLIPQDVDVINGFFRGNGTLYTAANLQGWLVPILAWSSFIFAIFWTLFCATSLVRRQWIEEERLTFPLVLLPLEMTGTTATLQGDTGVPFWRNKLMWAGFIIAGVLESVNFINFLQPSFPSLPIKPSMGFNHLETLFVSRPWNTIGTLTLAFYPFAIGIGYLLSLDVSFSCWFLYLLAKVSIVFCAALGLTDSGGGQSIAARLPFIKEQGVGAFVGVALFSAWMARRALAQAWREMKRPTGADRDELMPSRLAIIGGIIGMLFMVGFLWSAGFTPVMALIFVFVYLCFALTLARIVSEAGAGWAWAPGWSPAAFTVDSIGANHLTPQQLTMSLGYTQWMSDMRDNPMPQAMQSMKIAQGASLVPRAYLKPLLFAAVLGILLAFWAHLDIYYVYGSATAKVRPAISGTAATGAARNAGGLIVTPTLQDVYGLSAAFVGMLLSLGFSLMRQQFTWWPFHPLGYALATTSSMEYMWCPFLIAWLAKLITLRYGGIRAYRVALPFFLGLILGDYVVPTLWGIFGMVSGYQQYMAFPH